MGSLLMEFDDVISYNHIYRPNINDSSICLSIDNVHWPGIHSGTNIFEYAVPRIMAQLAVASSLVLFVTQLLKPLGQPSMVAQILGGLMIGPTFFGRIASFSSMVFPYDGLVIMDTISVFGYIFYFFLIGVQLDPLVLKRVTKREIIIGSSSVVLAMVLSFSLLIPMTLIKQKMDMDFDTISAIPVLATCSSIVTFPIVAHYLVEMKMANTKFGRMTLASSLISSVASYLIVSILVIVYTGDFHFFSKWFFKFSGGIAMILVIFFVFRPMLLNALRNHPEGEPVSEGLVNIVFVAVMVVAFFSKAVGVGVMLGPLLIGMAIPAGPPLGSALVEKLDLIISWFFMPLYFVKTGLVTDLSIINIDAYFFKQLVVFLACLGKFLAAFTTSLFSGSPLRESISIGLVMNVQGVLELYIFKLLKQAKIISDEVFGILCLSMLLVTITATFLLRYIYDPLEIYANNKKRSVISLKSTSELRILGCLYDEKNVPATVNLLEALVFTRSNPMDICLVHLVQLFGRAHPLLIHQAQNIYNAETATTSRGIISAFKHFQQRYCAIAQLDLFTSISSFETMHDIVCSKANERKASLILVPFHQKVRDNNVVFSSAGIRKVNDNISDLAPCTVAVIVDRGLVNTSRPKLDEWSPFRVAVLFLGGPDDREALAIGSRMVDHPNICLTIVRLHEMGSNIRSNSRIETLLDNDMFREVEVIFAGNSRVNLVDEDVLDATGTIGVIRSMENFYELIIVGKRHDSESQLLTGLADWTEDSGLGTIGDMLALAEFENNSTILVVQQQIELLHKTQECEKCD